EIMTNTEVKELHRAGKGVRRRQWEETRVAPPRPAAAPPTPPWTPFRQVSDPEPEPARKGDHGIKTLGNGGRMGRNRSISRRSLRPMGGRATARVWEKRRRW
ncbi:hypothetical protein B296_00013302, partial [Ensete ventricosum]